MIFDPAYKQGSSRILTLKSFVVLLPYEPSAL